MTRPDLDGPDPDAPSGGPMVWLLAAVVVLGGSAVWVWWPW